MTIPTLPRNHLARPGIGDNSLAVPLAELLSDELASDRARADELLASAKEARIADDADAGKVTALVALIRDHRASLKRQHDDRKAPFLEAGRAVDRAFNDIDGPLAVAQHSLLGTLTEYQRRREAEARAERERIEAERLAQEAEAERARQEAEAARASGNGSVAAELDAIRAQERADQLGRQAQTIRPEPIRSAIGSAGVRREVAFTITDEKKALAWLYKHRHGDTLQFMRTCLGTVVRSHGVAAVERGDVAIAGVELRIEAKAQVR